MLVHPAHHADVGHTITPPAIYASTSAYSIGNCRTCARKRFAQCEQLSHTRDRMCYTTYNTRFPDSGYQILGQKSPPFLDHIWYISCIMGSCGNPISLYGAHKGLWTHISGIFQDMPYSMGGLKSPHFGPIWDQIWVCHPTDFFSVLEKKSKSGPKSGDFGTLFWTHSVAISQICAPDTLPGDIHIPIWGS